MHEGSLSPATTLRVTGAPPGEITKTLALLVPASLLLGPIGSLSEGIRSIDILWFDLGLMVLALHLLFMGRLTQRVWRLELPSIALIFLVPAALLAPDPGLGIVVFYRLGMAIIGGWTFAGLWHWYGVERWSPFDTGIVIAGLGTSIQLMLALVSSSVLSYHEDAAVSWGASNYVAAVLIIVGLITWGRMAHCGVRRLWLVLPVIMLCMAVLTFSRGEFLALGAGLAFLFLRGFGSGQRWRFRRLALTALLAPIGFWVFDQITQERLIGTTAAHLQENLQNRTDLWGLSFQTFKASPVFGGGLGSLRPVSLLVVSRPITYAHNIELSMLGQAGLTALPYLLLLALGFYAVFANRDAAQFRPAVVALIVISQIEPMFEDSVGGSFGWAILLFCLFTWRSAPRRSQGQLNQAPDDVRSSA